MDNEALENEEEQGIIELLANQGEEIDDIAEEVDTDTDDIEVLRERIAKRNKSLKKSKQAVHRMQEKEDALMTRIDELEAKMTSAPSNNTGAEKQEREEALKQWRDSVEDDPTKSIDYANHMIAQMQEKTVDFLASMQSKFDAQLAEIKGDIDPEKAKYRDKINMLKANPEFSEMPDEYLLKFARASEQVKIPRGQVGGRKAELSHDPEQAYNEAREKFAQMFNG